MNGPVLRAVDHSCFVEMESFVRGMVKKVAF